MKSRFLRDFGFMANIVIQDGFDMCKTKTESFWIPFCAVNIKEEYEEF